MRPITLMDNYSNMKVIITGATGFIGREIVSELSEGGFELYQIGNSNVNSQFPQIKFFKIDITSFEEVCELKKLKSDNPEQKPHLNFYFFHINLRHRKYLSPCNFPCAR